MLKVNFLFPVEKALQNMKLYKGHTASSHLQVYDGMV